jgi:hypothetical protein
MHVALRFFANHQRARFGKTLACGPLPISFS